VASGPSATPIPRRASESLLGHPWARPLLSPATVPASCPAAPTYQRRQPERTVLYRTIQAHLPTFLARTAGQDGTGGLPAFVRREFEAYLKCGILGHG
jgi:hypothetical protein